MCHAVPLLPIPVWSSRRSSLPAIHASKRCGGGGLLAAIRLPAPGARLDAVAPGWTTLVSSVPVKPLSLTVLLLTARRRPVWPFAIRPAARLTRLLRGQPAGIIADGRQKVVHLTVNLLRWAGCRLIEIEIAVVAVPG